jgi:hypothetical protein
MSLPGDWANRGGDIAASAAVAASSIALAPAMAATKQKAELRVDIGFSEIPQPSGCSSKSMNDN